MPNVDQDRLIRMAGAARSLMPAEAAPVERRHATDALGIRRYMDDASEVFPGTAASLTAQQEAEATAAEAAAARPDFDNELSLSRDHAARSKKFQTIATSYGRLSESVNADTGAGDVGVIFSFMKILDPESTVREGEFATAEQTAGLPQQVVAMYNRARDGVRLTPTQRDNFKTLAGQYYIAAEDEQRDRDEWYTERAGAYGMDPGRVVRSPIRDALTQLARPGFGETQIAPSAGGISAPPSAPGLAPGTIPPAPVGAPDPAMASQLAGMSDEQLAAIAGVAPPGGQRAPAADDLRGATPATGFAMAPGRAPPTGMAQTRSPGLLPGRLPGTT